MLYTIYIYTLWIKWITEHKSNGLFHLISLNNSEYMTWWVKKYKSKSTPVLYNMHPFRFLSTKGVVILMWLNQKTLEGSLHVAPNSWKRKRRKKLHFPTSTFWFSSEKESILLIHLGIVPHLNTFIYPLSHSCTFCVHKYKVCILSTKSSLTWRSIILLS